MSCKSDSPPISPPSTPPIETTRTCRFEPSPKLPHHLTRRARTAQCGKPLRPPRGRGQESGREKAWETTPRRNVGVRQVMAIPIQKYNIDVDAAGYDIDRGGTPIDLRIVRHGELDDHIWTMRVDRPV